MNKLDKLLKLFAKKKKASQVNFVPRETISVSINNIYIMFVLLVMKTIKLK